MKIWKVFVNEHRSGEVGQSWETDNLRNCDNHIMWLKPRKRMSIRCLFSYVSFVCFFAFKMLISGLQADLFSVAATAVMIDCYK